MGIKNKEGNPFFQLLLDAMDKKLAGHKHYSSRQLKPMDKELRHKIEFKIKHYAGDVIYNINGFLDKNKDTLFQDFKRLLFKSNNPLITKMWPEGAQNILTVQKMNDNESCFNDFITLHDSIYSLRRSYLIKLTVDYQWILSDDKETLHRRHVIPQFYDCAGEESNEQRAVLRKMHQAQRSEVSGRVRQWKSEPPSEILGSRGEHIGETRRFRLQTRIRQIFEEVSCFWKPRMLSNVPLPPALPFLFSRRKVNYVWKSTYKGIWFY